MISIKDRNECEAGPKQQLRGVGAGQIAAVGSRLIGPLIFQLSL